MDKILGGDFDIMKNENDKTPQVDFWARAWQQASRHKRKGPWQKSNYEKSAAIWNTRADSFARNTAREKNQARIRAVFDVTYLNQPWEEVDRYWRLYVNASWRNQPMAW